ncbi:MAG: conserved repeat domain protein [Bacteroidetes bacterium]|uniref:T9SS type B sorting domain-containing protein n=1 Tax=Chitinophaga sp. LS1 TaxID=3051176 RepID=UPI001DF10830|nr:gliding motility-associated C-terminal domain-containing protein [Chitinophaga sp. LS1]MBP1649865.1 conserved repeat domain protein [Bacteroidota bacterium]WPV64516.1 gliding motility-associated C-terminal domain-containing protein [Chitinophaga sp. LS1]
MKQLFIFSFCLLVWLNVSGQANFTAPDTVCINDPVNITNTSVGASTYYWNFCGYDLYGTPTLTDLGNPGSLLYVPTFITIEQDNGIWYGFVSNFGYNSIVRLTYGSSLLNTPTAEDLGTFNGDVPEYTEGLQVVKDDNGWHLIVVGGYTTSKARIMKIDFGSSLGTAKASLTSTNWGNIGTTMNYPSELTIIKEGDDYWGLTVNASSNTVTRFYFGQNFTNAPTAENLGNVTGTLNFPTGIYAAKYNNKNYIFVTNTYAGTLVRMDFGTSIGNTPVSTDLGNASGVLTQPRDITIINDCGNFYGLVVNNVSHDIARVDFPNGVDGAITGSTLAISGLTFPHSISTMFRDGDNLYSMITDADAHKIFRLQFNSCSNSSTPSSTSATPPSPIIYDSAGVYSIHLLTNESLSTQSSFCKEVVVLAPPKPNLGKDTGTCGNGTVTLDAGEGRTYLWNTGATTRTIVVTTTGDYIVSVSNGYCEGRDTIHVSINKPLDLSKTVVTNVDCGGTLGQIEVMPTGGTYPYSYYFDGISQGSDSLYKNLDSGTYSIRVVDAIGCEIAQAYTVVQNTALAKPNLGKDTGTCGTGSVTLDAGEGLTYSWNTGETTRTIMATHTGDYIVTVSNGYCEGSDTIHVSINKPLDLTNTVVTNIDCGVALGQIEVMPTGGKYPYTYYFNGINEGKDSLYPKLDPGTYTVKVVDAVGCEIAQAFTVVEHTATIIRATASGTKPTCYDATDGSITIQVNKGVAPFEYTIDSFKTVQTTPVLTGLTQGNYKIYIRNAVCIDSVSIQLSAPAPLKTGVSLTNELCERGNGTIEVNPSGGTSPYAFYWGSELMTENTVSDISAGSYSILIRDAQNCTLDTTVIIENNNVAAVHIWNNDTTINIGQSVTLKATNSPDYAWTPEDGLSCVDCSSPVATPDSTTTYVVSTVTGLNCIPTDTVTVTVTHYKKLFIPTAFTPNGDGQNDVFRVKGLGITYFNMRVFNRVGNLVYATEDYSSGWDGKLKGEVAPIGTYVYVIQYAFYGDEMHPQMEKGTVTLIR